MGIVLKQSFWTSAFAYLGAILGLVNQIFLFPEFMSPKQVGLFSQLQSLAILLASFALMGMSAAAVKFTPVFKNDKAALSEFNFHIFSRTTIGIIITGCIVYIFSDAIISFYSENSPLVGEYFYVAVSLMVIITYLSLNEAISKANYKVIQPNILKDVLVRLLGLFLILLFGYKLISFDQVAHGILLLYFPSLLILIFLNARNGFLNFTFKKYNISNKVKEINKYALFSLLGASGSIVVLNVDVQMVSGMINLEANGIYTRAFYMAVMIELPRRAISQIAIPIISNSFNNNDLSKVKDLYKKLSINQMIIGMLLFLGVIINLDSIYLVMSNGESYKEGKLVVYIIGIAKIIDMSFSVNGEIILMSKYYRFSTISILILAFLTILLNYLLIPLYGMYGAAAASLISVIIFNLLKMILIWLKFDIQPFKASNLYLLIISMAIWFINGLIPIQENVLIDILLRSSIVTILFCGIIYSLRISPDLNELINKRLSKIVNRR